MGNIITFYSYKGGVGRSMALANTGVLLAQWGYRVLMVDFDLEAPGLENFFSSLIDVVKIREQSGIVDFISSGLSDSTKVPSVKRKNEFVKVPLTLTKGTLWLWTAGRRDTKYFKRVRDVDFREFYSTKNGGALIEELRKELKREYDFVLVDSRTGLTETGGVCTVQLPDMIVLLFTATDQAFQGGLDIVQRASISRQKMPFERVLVPTVPVPSRLDVQAEFRLSQKWLDKFAQELVDVYDIWLPRAVNPRTLLDMMKLPHVSYFSYGETLPVREHGTTDPGGLGYAYENLAALMAKNLQDVESLISNRDAYVRQAAKTVPKRSPRDSESRIFISYSHEDKVWLQRLQSHLSPLTKSRDLVIWDDSKIVPGQEWREDLSRAISEARVAVILVSPAYLASRFITEHELPTILKGAEGQGLRVVWVALRPSLYQETELGRFQALNNPAKPLSSLSGNKRDLELANVAQKIAEAAGQKY